MDEEIVNVVNVLGDPSSDPALKSQAFDYLNQLRLRPGSWQVCAALFARTPHASDVVRLVCLEIVNAALHTQNLGAQDLRWLKERLWAHVRLVYGPASQVGLDPVPIQNKLCQTLTYLFVFLYQTVWQTFIDDFLLLAGPSGVNTNGAIIYLRILSSIHDEIADLLLTRQSSEAKRRNAELKNQLRIRDMQQIAQSWQDILAYYYVSNEAITEFTLRVVGKWAGWAEISLVMSQDMLSLLLPLVGRTSMVAIEDKIRDAAINTLTEICGKKMKSEDKLNMFTYINLHGIISRLADSRPLSDFRTTPEYDLDLAEAVSKLVNTGLSDMVKVLEDGKASDEVKVLAHQHIRQLIPYLHRFLSDEYDEVCTSVLPAATDVLTALRKLPARPAFYDEFLPAILNAIVMKMRYDDSSSWGKEDEQSDEAEFQELRKRLQILQRLVEAVNPDLYINTLSVLVANTFDRLDKQGPEMDWRDLDLALHEMYIFGELALPNQGLGSKNAPSVAATERLAAMILKMTESGIAQFPHPAILLQYMELCVRYCTFFESHIEVIPRVLENFVRLVHYDHVRIRTRSWYLFYKFVKHLRSYIGGVVETVIQSIRDLLVIKAEIPGEDGDGDMSSDETDHSADAAFNSQLYLFQAVGCMLSTGSWSSENRTLYIRSVTDQLFSGMDFILSRAKEGDGQAVLQMHHIIMGLGTLAHGFSEGSPGSGATSKNGADKAVMAEFSRAAEVTLIALGQLNSSAEIRQAGRAAFTRLLSVLGAELLPQLPQWIDGLLSERSGKDEMALFLRVLDQVVHEFKTEIFEVLNSLVTPLLGRIFEVLSEPVAGTDDEIQRVELSREYLSFLLVILSNKLEQVFVSDTNQNSFELMIGSVLELGCQVRGNLAQSKLAFMVMGRIANIWGGPNIATIADKDATAPWEQPQPQPVLAGFDQYLINRFLPVSWKVLRDVHLKPESDGQSRQLVAEIALLQQLIYTKTGPLFIQNLEQDLAPSLGMNAGAYMQALTTSVDKKLFPAYLSNLIKDPSLRGG